MKLKSLFVIFFLLIFIMIFGFYNKKSGNFEIQSEIYTTNCGEYEKREIIINSTVLSVDISDSDCKRVLGLSGKTSLNEEGMLFVFNEVGNHGFWMKDMNFPIDILWIGTDYKIIGIENNVSPDSYPKSFGETYLAKYVLEVQANFSLKNKIKLGDKIIFK